MTKDVLKVSIGLPVFNGEKTIGRAIESILSQTFKEFIVIISDNASTDSTQIICEEYEKKDKRIRYIRQKNNLGPLKNFRFLLDITNSKYFVWIAHDDFWDKKFLEKNIGILDSKKDVVGSIGQTNFIGDFWVVNKNEKFIRKTYKKIRRHFLSLECYSTNGSKYEDRIKNCLKSSRYPACIYSLFRTNILKKSINHTIHPWDAISILKILKYGNLHVFDETLLYRGQGGVSNTNSIELLINKKVKFHEILINRIPFQKWCIQNLGKKVFLQNIGYFIKLGSSGPQILLLDTIKFLFKKDRKKIYFEEDLGNKY
ncbi:glycosyltransferase family 2 protein [Nitrosopumilus ureiphilus]|uniref:glycosyltransferase family 2 protein n=1 Tax=Nitrosopumilus ureiphilus TaxID=1470067 RepID=UPI001FEB423B|nr:glycosyltransferase family 2 protein [Nitrosopumilus ureiphilus]